MPVQMPVSWGSARPANPTAESLKVSKWEMGNVGELKAVRDNIDRTLAECFSCADKMNVSNSKAVGCCSFITA